MPPARPPRCCWLDAASRVLAVDRSAYGSDTLSTHALLRGGVLQLARWGVLDDVIAAGTPPIRRTTFVYADDRVDITMKPSHGVDALYAPRAGRCSTDSWSMRLSTQAPRSTTARRSTRSPGRPDGRRERGIVSADGQAREISAGLVIGADGTRSTVARLVGAPTERQSEHTTAVTYGYWSECDHGLRVHFRPNAAAGVIPTNDGQANVFASASPEVIGRGGIDVLRRIVAVGHPELAARLAGAVAPTGTRTWTGQPGFIRRSHGPGWALVGDAGYFKDPIGAHGLTNALRDAELLARAVLEGFDAPASIGDALAEYQATRDRLTEPLFDVIERIASQQWDDDEISSLLLQLSAATVDEVETLAALDAEAVR